MAILHFNNVGISALAACVPSHVIDNYKYTDYFSAEDAKTVVGALICDAISHRLTPEE